MREQGGMYVCISQEGGVKKLSMIQWKNSERGGPQVPSDTRMGGGKQGDVQRE